MLTTLYKGDRVLHADTDQVASLERRGWSQTQPQQPQPQQSTKPPVEPAKETSTKPATQPAHQAKQQATTPVSKQK